jgi:precorrin-6B methylase 2
MSSSRNAWALAGSAASVIQGKAPAQLDHIDPKPVEHILIDDGQLLDNVVDADRF